MGNRLAAPQVPQSEGVVAVNQQADFTAVSSHCSPGPCFYPAPKCFFAEQGQCATYGKHVAMHMEEKLTGKTLYRRIA